MQAEKITALSHTRMTTWEQCRYLFKAVYLDKVEAPKSIPMLIGGFFHEWADGYVKHLIKTKQGSDLDEGRALLERMWQKRQTSKEFKFLPENCWDEIEGLVEKFLSGRFFDPADLAGAEVELAFDREWKIVSWFAPEAFFRLKMDRLDIKKVGDKKVCIITDYKTGWAMDDPDNAQLRRYVMGATMILPADKYVAAMDFVRFEVVKEVEISPIAAEKEKGRIMAVSSQIEMAKKTGEFFATPGEQCAFCPVFASCPAKKFAEEFRAPQTADEALSALHDMILLDRRLKDLKAALQPWVLMNGPVVSGTTQYGVLVKKIREFDVPAVDAWAQEYNVDPAVIMKVDTKEIDKILGRMKTAAKKGNPGAEKALEAFPQPALKPHTEYRLMAVKENEGE